MRLIAKILCIVFILALIRYAESLPQFSIPIVSWSKNREEPSFPLNLKVQDIFSSPFGRNSNARQHEKTQISNEVVNSNEILITVTPNPDSYINYYNVFLTKPFATQDPRGWKNINKDIVMDIKKKQNVETDTKCEELNVKNEFKSNLRDDDDNRLVTDYDGTTTESTTEYESTTYDDSYEIGNRLGNHGHVVATLLG